MGRKVVERFDHGEYVFEEVVEMLPLGEDRNSRRFMNPSLKNMENWLLSTPSGHSQTRTARKYGK
ncbi:MAG: hypothetical protein JRJ20_07570 [Deltaproteobacteria bacterium]|nr:hypothetical protein [Deltaproteobacteria bacterium]